MIPASDFLKKVVVITTFGRCLIFVKRNRIQPETNLFFDLVYDINLSQKNVKIKEIVQDNKGEENNEVTFVIETPFKSFVFKCGVSDITWLATAIKSVKLNHERLLSKHKAEEPSSLASKAAKLASPTLASTATFGSDASASFVQPSPKGSSATKSPLKNNYGISSAPASAGSKPERLFDNFLNNRGRQNKKSAKPVPLSGKLTNGLPTGPSYSSFGLSEPSARNVPTSGQTSRTVSDKSSRMLARSERSLRR